MKTRWLYVGLLSIFLAACRESTIKSVSNGTSVLGALEIELTGAGSSAMRLKKIPVQLRGFVGDGAIQITRLISRGALDSNTRR